MSFLVGWLVGFYLLKIIPADFHSVSCCPRNESSQRSCEIFSPCVGTTCCQSLRKGEVYSGGDFSLQLRCHQQEGNSSSHHWQIHCAMLCPAPQILPLASREERTLTPCSPAGCRKHPWLNQSDIGPLPRWSLAGLCPSAPAWQSGGTGTGIGIPPLGKKGKPETEKAGIRSGLHCIHVV